MKYSAFISYRRIGGAEKAELLKAVLCKKGYRAKDIFMDTYTIHTGNYVQNIEQAIAQSKNFIVIITKGCFNNLEEDGIWVHELKLAKDLGLNIIPVYFDGIRKLDRSDLPAPISDLPLDNAVIYSHDYADASYERICSFMVGPKPINWLKIIRNNIISFITFIVAIVIILITNKPKEVERTDDSINLTEIVMDSNEDQLPGVELSVIFSAFINKTGFRDWGTFAKLPGFKMVSDHLVDEKEFPSPFRLSYEIYLTLNGKNVYENTFGERVSCSFHLYGPRAGFDAACIDIGYGYGGDLQNIDEYIRMLFPDYQYEPFIGSEMTGHKTIEYILRDNLFLGIIDDHSGNAIGSIMLYISNDKADIDYVIKKYEDAFRAVGE